MLSQSGENLYPVFSLFALGLSGSFCFFFLVEE